MSSHLFSGTPRTAVLIAVHRLLSLGATGVDLFFVLSGFLITGILYDSLDDARFFRKFYMRRLLRIAPLYYGVLAVFALGTLLFSMHYSGELLALTLYLQNTYLVSVPMYAYTGPAVLPLSHFWSLAVEEQFYLVWPVVVFFLRTKRALLWACLIAVVGCPLLRFTLWMHGWSYFAVHQNTVARADALLSGGALALLIRSDAREQTLRLCQWVFLSGAVFVCFLDWFPSQPHGSAWGSAARLALRYSAFNLLYASLIALVLYPTLFSTVARTQVLRAAGRYSYGLYVFHIPVFTYLQMPLHRLLHEDLHFGKGLTVLLTGVLCFACSVCLAVLSFRFYERPFLKLKTFFSYRHS